MKNMYILFACCLSFQVAFAGPSVERQKVYSLVKQKQTTDWYQAQAKAWNEYLTQNQTDADAWLNYYTAMRMLKIYQVGVTDADLIKVVSSIEKAIPNSFEYHYIAYWNDGFRDKEKALIHLNKAQELGPNRVELLDDLLTRYEVDRDKQNLKITAKKWFLSNDISAGLFNWNYNMLQSTETDAILFTVGDNDTYPALVLQYANGIRTDVAVLNTSLIGIDEYRNKYFKELGIREMTSTGEDFKDYEIFQKAIIAHIIENTYRPVYFAVSASNNLYEAVKDHVYNVGMAYKYSPNKFDNMAVIKKNYEKVYLIDHLKMEFNNDISQGVVDHMNSNYLISLLPLYNHYKESEDLKMSEIEGIVNRIAEKNNMEDEVASVLKSGKNLSPSTTVKDAKVIEKYFQKITDTLYAGTTEVTNQMYSLFLVDMLNKKQFDDLNMARANAVNWRAFLSKEKQPLSDKEIFPNGSPDDDLAPVCNITHEAAVLYCKWLTDTYKQLDPGKKKYANVEFRLPSEKEWTYVASGGNSKAKYPWEGDFVRNSKGCFLGNFLVDEKDQTLHKTTNSLEDCTLSNVDGSLFPVNASSYFPNKFGLYCMAGNVAEMIDEKGIAKGGSWNTRPANATINGKEEYAGPSATVGFRVVMIVK